MPGSDRVNVAILVPGTHPLEALATILARIATNDPTPVKKSREFREELAQVNTEDTYDGLRRIADALPDITISPLIILVDQFEEIYTLCQDSTERTAFIKNLLYAAADPSKRVSVIVTMRSDFLGETQKLSVLNTLFAEQGFLVRAMNEPELKDAISKPADQAGHPLDQATISLLIEQTEDREGALPLLQFALSRIWEGLEQRVSPAITLENIGGVGGALAGEAERVYQALPPEEQTIARRLFLALIQLGEGTRDTRRRIAVTRLVSHRDNLKAVKQVLEKFSASSERLITCAATEEGTETAEVTHEALFDHWIQLQQWLNESRSDLRFKRQLEAAAADWETMGKPEGKLWRPPDLDLLRQYHERTSSDMTPLEIEFFIASVHALEQAEQAIKRQRRLLVGVLATGLIMTTGAAVFATYQVQRVERERVEQLARTAEALLSDQPVEALIHAIASTGLSQSTFVQFPDRPQFHSVYGVLLDAIRTNSELNRLKGHEDMLFSVAVDPNGSKIASASYDRTLRLWDAASGQLIGEPLRGHNDAIFAVAFSPDGSKIASASKDQTLRLWDANSGQPIGKPLTGHADWVVSVAFSPDGSKIVSASYDETIRLWDAASGQPISAPLRGHEGWIIAAFNPDGSKIVSVSQDQTIRFWGANSGQPIGEPLTGHEAGVHEVAFSPDGSKFVSASYDHTLRLWDANSGQPIGKPLTGHTDWVFSVAFSPDGSKIVSASRDQTLRLWDADSGQPISKPLKGHEDGVASVVFSPDGSKIISASGDQTLRLWDADSGQPISKPLKGHEDGVTSVVFSPDSSRIISASDDQTLRLWDTISGQPIGEPFTGHKDGVLAVAFSPDGSKIISASRDQTLRLWDAESGQSTGEPLTGHKDEVLAVAFSPDGSKIISASRDQTLRLWDAESGQSIGESLTGHKDGIASVAFSPDGSKIVSASGDETLLLWDATSGQPIGAPLRTGHGDGVLSVAFSPDGSKIVSAGLDHTLRLWDATSGQSIGDPLIGHNGRVTSVAFSPDGSKIVSASWDYTIRLWDTISREPIGKPLTGHKDNVSSVAFSPDGSAIISASEDQTIRRWEISQEKLLERACNQMRNHSSLTEPQTDVAKKAKRTCDRYVWQR
ncbi:hypothetical protein IXB50_21405 [Leptothoe spongobia TAU-MAC 1115]|uniref:Novel STAND NTPase 1 domain-containing protein n=1 Tax=Leptothoe spongobia TAU-MAC 1115 TaxID=1967444 RepID=A0A947DNC2_9CYAN|nr:hypothetical protein [Leptothoe spongobia TAU-MAC 1115]